MSELVKLPRNMVEAINDYKTSTTYWEAMVISIALDNEKYFGPSEYCHSIKEFVRDHMNIKVLMRALVNGYEIEESPEDKVRQYYDGINTDYQARKAVSNVLDLLKIKIEGVNA